MSTVFMQTPVFLIPFSPGTYATFLQELKMLVFLFRFGFMACVFFEIVVRL